MGFFGKKKDSSSSDVPQVPVVKDVMRVTYTDSRGSLMQHDVVIDKDSPNKEFSVRHIIADRVDSGAKVHRIDKIGEER
jgi:hypothetical protein